MKTLALEFSSALRSAAAAEGLRLLGVARESAPREKGPVALVEEALRAASWTAADVEGVVVGLGPGSYHGVRVAIAVAQGWALSRGVRVQGVDTPGCLVAQAHAQGVRGMVDVVIDAQRGEFYQEGFRLEEAGWSRTAPLRLVGPESLAERVASGVRLIGSETPDLGLPVTLVGPDAAFLVQLASVTAWVAAGALEPIYLREAQFVKAPAARHW